MHDQPQTRPQNHTPKPHGAPPPQVRAEAAPGPIIISKNVIQTGRVRIVIDENWW